MQLAAQRLICWFLRVKPYLQRHAQPASAAEQDLQLQMRLPDLGPVPSGNPVKQICEG